MVKSKYTIQFLGKYYLPANAYLFQAILFFSALFTMEIAHGDYSFVNRSSGLYPHLFHPSLLVALLIFLYYLIKKEYFEMLYEAFLGALLMLLFIGPVYFVVVKVLYTYTKEPLHLRGSGVENFYVYESRAGKGITYKGAYGYFDLDVNSSQGIENDAYIATKKPHFALSKRAEWICIDGGASYLKAYSKKRVICETPQDRRYTFDLYGYTFDEEIYIQEMIFKDVNE